MNGVCDTQCSTHNCWSNYCRLHMGSLFVCFPVNRFMLQLDLEVIMPPQLFSIYVPGIHLHSCFEDVLIIWYLFFLVIIVVIWNAVWKNVTAPSMPYRYLSSSFCNWCSNLFTCWICFSNLETLSLCPLSDDILLRNCSGISAHGQRGTWQVEECLEKWFIFSLWKHSWYKCASLSFFVPLGNHVP